MSEGKIIVTAGFSFNSKKEQNIKEYQDALILYQSNLEKAISLGDLPIFVDTNVLLNIYKVSSTIKNKILNGFFDAKKQNIYLTNQVEQEFLKNRETNANTGFLQAQEELCLSFNSKILNNISSFSNDNKKILQGDYQFVFADLKEIETRCRELHDKIQSKKTEIVSLYNNLAVEDEALKVYSELCFAEKLEEEELAFIKAEFNNLKDSRAVFPGKEDIKKKPDDPYGDYIVFHELLKFAKQYDTDLVFLTHDKKQDWFAEGNKPILSYVYSSYSLTGHIIYILDADRALSEYLKLSEEDLEPLRPEESPLSILSAEFEQELRGRNKELTAVENRVLLASVYKEVVEKLHPLSKALLRDHATLSKLDLENGKAYISLSSKPLAKIAASKLSDLERSFLETFEVPVKVILFVEEVPEDESNSRDTDFFGDLPF